MVGSSASRDCADHDSVYCPSTALRGQRTILLAVGSLWSAGRWEVKGVRARPGTADVACLCAGMASRSLLSLAQPW